MHIFKFIIIPFLLRGSGVTSTNKPKKE